MGRNPERPRALLGVPHLLGPPKFSLQHPLLGVYRPPPRGAGARPCRPSAQIHRGHPAGRDLPRNEAPDASEIELLKGISTFIAPCAHTACILEIKHCSVSNILMDVIFMKMELNFMFSKAVPKCILY